MARSRRSASPARSRAPARRPATSAPTRQASSAPARQAAPTTPAPAKSSGGGMLSGIGSTIAQGMAFGTGSAIAHQAVGAVAGAFGGGKSESTEPITGEPVEQQHDTMQQSSNICNDEKKMFYDCLNVNKGDQQSCTFLMDMVKDCQLQSNNQAQMYN